MDVTKLGIIKKTPSTIRTRCKHTSSTSAWRELQRELHKHTHLVDLRLEGAADSSPPLLVRSSGSPPSTPPLSAAIRLSDPQL